MSTPAWCVRSTDDLAHARREMNARDVSHLPVLGEDDRIVGMLSAAEIFGAARVSENPRARPDLAALPVERAMARGAFTVSPDEGDVRAARELLAARVSLAPVAEDGVVVGVVSARDLLRALGPRVAGTFRVKDASRPELPTVHRHATLPAVLSEMRANGVRDVAVTEGRAPLIERGGSPEEYGIVGVVTMKSALASAWFDRHDGRSAEAKRIVGSRRTSAGAGTMARHVELTEWVAEDFMSPEVPFVDPDLDASRAASRFADTGASGLPVLGAGLASPGFLDRQDFLEAVVQRAGRE